MRPHPTLLIPAVVLLLGNPTVPAVGQPVPQLADPPTTIAPSSITVTRIPEGSPSQSCTRVYDNTVNFTGEFYSSQNTAEAIDDLHMIEGGGLCSFIFGYNEPGSGPVSATVTFYAQDGTDAPPAMVVAGPFNITGLPSGANEVEVEVTGGPVLGPDVWMGVRFGQPGVGLLISDPPVTGFSHDFYYENGNYFFFGGNPRANFFMAVESELAVPAEPTTWGLLKNRHR